MRIGLNNQTGILPLKPLIKGRKKTTKERKTDLNGRLTLGLALALFSWLSAASLVAAPPETNPTGNSPPATESEQDPAIQPAPEQPEMSEEAEAPISGADSGVRIIDQTENQHFWVETGMGFQTTHEFPIYHWGYGASSTSLEGLTYHLNYENYYGSEVTAPFFSGDFLTVEGYLDYQVSNYFAQIGGGLFIFPYKFEEEITESTGFVPTAGLGYRLREIPFGLTLELGQRTQFFRDGFWFNFNMGLDWKFHQHLSIFGGFLYRVSLANEEKEGVDWQDARAEIPYFGIRFHWE